jgi:hypothetical protein
MNALIIYLGIISLLDSIVRYSNIPTAHSERDGIPLLDETDVGFSPAERDLRWARILYRPEIVFDFFRHIA